METKKAVFFFFKSVNGLIKEEEGLLLSIFPDYSRHLGLEKFLFFCAFQMGPYYLFIEIIEFIYIVFVISYAIEVDRHFVR